MLSCSQLVRQLLHIPSDDNNLVLFHLWWRQVVLKRWKVCKCFVQDCIYRGLIVKVNESRYNQGGGNPTLFHRAKYTEKKIRAKINIDTINREKLCALFHRQNILKKKSRKYKYWYNILVNFKWWVMSLQKYITQVFFVVIWLIRPGYSNMISTKGFISTIFSFINL